MLTPISAASTAPLTGRLRRRNACNRSRSRSERVIRESDNILPDIGSSCQRSGADRFCPLFLVAGLDPAIHVANIQRAKWEAQGKNPR
jgi:hypothetical protein